MRNTIRFVNPQRSDFLRTARGRVDAYFKENNISKHANATMVIKTIVMFAMYFVPYFLILFNDFTFLQTLPLFVLMGAGLAGIGLCVMHDASHGSYSSNRKVNNILSYSLNVIGGNVFNWKIQHNVLHHSFTNIQHHDEDIDGRGLMRFSPHDKLKWFHRYQYIYAFGLYGLMCFVWVVWKDYAKFKHYIKEGHNRNNKEQNRKEMAILIGSKVVWLIYMIAIPLIFTSLAWWQLLLGVTLMLYVGGLILSVIFQLAHVVEGMSYPLPDDKGNIENEWAIHQMHNTVNFATDNTILNWYAGGLNFQVEHHLFADICHVHYKKISEILRETAAEYNVPYLENKTFFGGLASHIRWLKQLGRPSQFNVVN